MDKIRCIKDKTGEVKYLSQSVARNSQFMSKYGFRIEEVEKPEPVKNFGHVVKPLEPIVETPEPAKFSEPDDVITPNQEALPEWINEEPELLGSDEPNLFDASAMNLVQEEEVAPALTPKPKRKPSPRKPSPRKK